MWSKLLILALTAVFMFAVSVPAVAHSGRISNVIDDPDETDEHPWGGGNENSDDPQFTTDPIDNPLLVSGPNYFIHVTLMHSWFSIRNFFWEINQSQNPEPKRDSGPIPLDIENNTDNTDQGARNQ